MPSTVYKGDLAEVSFGHETGIVLIDGYANDQDTFGFTHTTLNSADNTSVITFAGGSANTPVNSGVFEMPVGMLVGCKLSVRKGSGGNFTSDDSTTTGRIYTIIANSNNTITITPALKTAQSTVSAGGSGTDLSAGDAIIIHGFGCPTFDVGSTYNATSTSSSESVLTDQFLGLTSALTLPETKVDLKRYHVVGLGRDIAVQAPGRFINEGGSFEVNMHNPRWLYYCLGTEAVDIGTTYDSTLDQDDYLLDGAVSAGATYVVIDETSGTNAPTFDAGGAVTVGDYIVFKDTNTIDIVSYKEATGTNIFGDASDPATKYIDKTQKSEIRRIAGLKYHSGHTYIWLDDALCFAHDNDTVVKFVRFREDSTHASPDRASTGALTNGVTRLLYSRSTVPSFAMEVSIRRTDVDGSDLDVVDGGTSDSKQLTRVFKGCKVKDFSLTTDTDAALRLTVNYDAAFCYTDTGRLEGAKATATLTALSKTAGQANTRVLTLSDGSNSVNFSIDNSTSTSTASVIGFSNANSNANQFATNIAAAVNAADTAGTLNMSAVASDATVTLTQNDNGVAGNTTPSGTAISDSVITLASAFSGGQSTGDRYNPHRMFEDTANTKVKRKESGVAVGTQKPFMFYNGQITIGGTTVAQVVSFNLSGSTGVTQYYTINGTNTVDAATDQVPFTGSRNPSIAVEGKTEYSMDMEIIVDDPLFYHKVRRAVGHDASVTSGDQIRLSFTKSGTAATRETLDIQIDDYVITEAPLQIPEDKGPIRSPLKILPKGIKVISTDTLFHC